MNKYAFIENVPDLSVDAYSDCFDDGEWMNLIAGFNGMDKVMEYAKELIADGYSLIDLCGDFNEEYTRELMKDAPEGVEVHYAAYLPEEVRKLEALEEYKNGEIDDDQYYTDYVKPELDYLKSNMDKATSSGF